ncbi:MAG: aminoacyl-tRNA hydrolase [Deltaproteobacteria bacterium]|nr:aminoacyl-tRNA hydrolase [Deltaproteobacteria bacterium]MBW2318740.1 aminoacyl-tRNA hydrolase [Deltaproteobacteria bacterium]OEU45513.1 MAG: peptide chain release factor 1 [Desulfobacterales bacterium S7086C20]
MNKITDHIDIPDEELSFTASRSSGPGGQNVNKVNTRVTLWFDVANSPSLSAWEKKRIRARLSMRVNKKGVLRVVSQKHRTQAANRETAMERFVELLRDALKKDKTRRRMKVPKVVDVRRLKNKKRRGLIKRQRSKGISSDDL